MTLDELKNGSWEVLPMPVLRPSLTGWDSHSSMTPVVFRNEEMGVESASRYGMLFVGAGLRSSAWGLGYASSDDLITWTRNAKNPVLLQKSGSHFQLDAPCLVKTGDGLSLICEEKKVKNGPLNSLREILSPEMKLALRRLRRSAGLEKPTVVNHASGRYFVGFTSNDILSWSASTKKIVFEKGPQGAFDSEGVFSPQIYKFNNRYFLFYGGTDGHKAYTGLASSQRPDTGWSLVSSKPVLSPGGKGEWDEVNSLIVSVVALDDCYCAFYEGEDSQRRYSIGIAWSQDLLNWVKWERNPVIAPGSAPYCEHMVCGPRAFCDSGEMYVFFNGHGRDMRGHCGMARFRRGE